MDATEKIKMHIGKDYFARIEPEKKNNNSVTNGKPHQQQNNRENLLIQRISQDVYTSLDQLNVQQNWPHVPGFKKTYRN